ncbi:MAG: GUN4 N-terminal ARM-like repeat domain-containing protein [Coleofasciculaceae cyanobacterium]
MINQTTPSVPLDPDQIAELTRQFDSGSEKKQLQLIPDLVTAGPAGREFLMKFLEGQPSTPPSLVAGFAYQALYEANRPEAREFLQSKFPQGIVPLNSDKGIDYSKLQHLLVERDFLRADSLTLEKLCELAGPAAIQRKWPYFSEVDKFPITDLQTINNLWFIHSQGHFGFSVQRELWLSVGKNWEKLWPKIGWKTGNDWTRYPNEFIWDLKAPRGHLPLTNQLRGVRVMASLLSHRAWNK